MSIDFEKFHARAGIPIRRHLLLCTGGLYAFASIAVAEPTVLGRGAAPVAIAAATGQGSVGNSKGDELLSIQELSANGLHYDALRRFVSDRSSSKTLADQLAIANSAWALGLIATARTVWDEALANRELSGPDRTRTMLARAILELQEGNAEGARKIAEEAARRSDASELRGQLWLVVGEALTKQGALSQAEGYLKRAAEETTGEGRHEALILLGECQLKLGLIDDARYSLASIGAQSRYSLTALRHLIEVDLQQRDFEGVLTWIAEGRTNHPVEFSDPWMSYAHVTALLELGRIADAGTELQRFRKAFSNDNTWFGLAEAAYESRVLNVQYPRARLAAGDKSIDAGDYLDEGIATAARTVGKRSRTENFSGFEGE